MSKTEALLQIASLFLANAGLIMWFRSESLSDWRHIDAKTDAITREKVGKMKWIYIAAILTVNFAFFIWDLVDGDY